MNDPTVDWTVRHGHAIALSAVLHDAAERIVSQGLLQAVTDAAVLHASTDRVSEIEITSWKARAYGIFTRVLAVSEIELVSSVNE